MVSLLKTGDIFFGLAATNGCIREAIFGIKMTYF
jgi:hypothetical protein